MIVTLEEAKSWLKDVPEIDEPVVDMLIQAAEKALYNATGNVFDNTNELAKLYCLVLICDWYENREMNEKISEKVRFTIQSILTQLKYCYEPPEVVT